MGAQQSTRKLTLDNDDPTNVIKVSDAVVDRLRGTAGARNQGASTSGAPRSAPPPQATATPPSSSLPLYPQYVYETGNPSSIHLRQDKEAALKRNDQYWQKRINELEETHSKINQIMEKEYKEAVKEVSDGFQKPDGGAIKKPVCIDNKKAVMQCYKQYPNEPMRCAREVQAFAECVDKHRTELVANRG